MIQSVTVFCASSPAGPRKEEYLALAERFGALLGEHGFTCVNGGNHGMMTSVSRGAHQAGGKVHCILLNAERFPLEHNFHHLLEDFIELVPRQVRLLELGDAYVALPGGVGTLYEVMQVLAMKSLDEIDPQKLMICVGDTWRHFQQHLQSIVESGLVYRNPLTHIHFVDTPEEALQLLVAQRSL